jgi:hypothetical protein
LQIVSWVIGKSEVTAVVDVHDLAGVSRHVCG